MLDSLKKEFACYLRNRDSLCSLKSLTILLEGEEGAEPEWGLVVGVEEAPEWE